MGTRNFATPNASNYFVVLQNEEIWECDDCNYVQYEAMTQCKECESKNITNDTRTPEIWEIEDFKNFMLERIKEVFEDAYRYDENNICSFIVEKIYANCGVALKFNVFLQYGYYEAAILDYRIDTVMFNGYECDAGDFDYMFERAGLKKGLAKMLQNKATKWLEIAEKETRTKLEKIFAENSSPYTLAGVFSNGEAIYTKVN